MNEEQHINATTGQDVVEEVATKAVQSAGVATFAQLKAKPRRTLSFPVYTQDEDGNDVALTMKYRALSSKEYDDLVAKHPPTAKEKRDGANWHADTFAPALIAEVSMEPKLTVEEATELYHDPEWSGGEITSLFLSALRVCNSGIDVPFSDRG